MNGWGTDRSSKSSQSSCFNQIYGVDLLLTVSIFRKKEVSGNIFLTKKAIFAGTVSKSTKSTSNEQITWHPSFFISFAFLSERFSPGNKNGKSPAGKLHLTITLTQEGQMSYTFRSAKREFIHQSDLGYSMNDNQTVP